MLDRREFLKAAGLAALAPAACVTSTKTDGAWVNDIHSQLNRTWVSAVRQPTSIDALRAAMRGNGPVCVAGGRHAMGGQQFASNATLLDMNGMTRVLGLDREAGIIEVEAGIQWPALIAALKDDAVGHPSETDGRGPAVHRRRARGERPRPRTDDEAVHRRRGVVHAGRRRWRARRVQPHEEPRAVLARHRRLRAVRRRGIGEAAALAAAQGAAHRGRAGHRDASCAPSRTRIADGFLYGDFQFSIDAASDGFLRKGVFSCYKPVSDDTPMPAAQAELKPEDWMKLLYLAHADKEQVYRAYVGYYLSTSGQVYWSDEHQLSFYPDDYHQALDPMLKTPPGTEMITELYVPRPKLADFMLAAARGIAAAQGERHLRHGAAHRARRRELPGVGEAAVCLRHLQPARRAFARPDRRAPPTRSVR